MLDVEKLVLLIAVVPVSIFTVAENLWRGRRATATMPSYDKIHEWQTRLIIIKPNPDPSARLDLSLIVADLVDLSTGAVIEHKTIVTYDALSYTWGNSLPSIACVCDGNETLLRDNLDSALRYLRRPQHDRYVWIDFLCINQEDLVEKSVQIPRMRSIYSKASTVIIWLGESPALESISKHCDNNCEQDHGFLDCSRHKEEVWEAIVLYTWFERAWVRQEVHAAQRLNICSPYFSAPWENFIKSFKILSTRDVARREKAFQNIEAINLLYDEPAGSRAQPPASRLVDLLEKGQGFQASVPHDHIFSVLGMVYTRKHHPKLIPVTYIKPYHEICGDVTRFIIQETGSIYILKLCTLQRNKSYAMDWPTVEWPKTDPTYEHSERILSREETDQTSGAFVEWFNIENPITEIDDLLRPVDPTSSPRADQLISRRPLVLYGRVWGNLAFLPDISTVYGRLMKPIEAYLAEDTNIKERRREQYFEEEVEEYRNFSVFKCGPIRCVLGDVLYEYETAVSWRCSGRGRAGDVFVSLEPGPSNIILRRCLTPGDRFEIVGWGGEMEGPTTRHQRFAPAKDESAYYIADVEKVLGKWVIAEAKLPREQRKRFEIR
jgi:hypothetical protein